MRGGDETGGGDGHPAGPPGSVAAVSCKLVAPRTTPEGENVRSLTFFCEVLLGVAHLGPPLWECLALLLLVDKVSVGRGDTRARQAPCV